MKGATPSYRQRPSILYNDCFQYQSRAQTVSGKRGAPKTQHNVGANLDTHQVLQYANQLVPTQSKRVFYRTEGMDVRNSRKEKIHKFNGKKEHVMEIKLFKVPTLEDLQEQMSKYKDKLDPFYRKDNIKKLTEQQLMAGETVDINSIDIEQRENFLSDKINSNFKEIMARKMVDQLKPPTDEELLKINEPKPDPILTDAIIDEEEGNIALGQLKRQFEDNEANIIHDLYSQHFRTKQEADAERKQRQALWEQEKLRPKATGQPMPDPQVYSHDLDKEIKYVQYIPKEAKGTIEDAINRIYIEGDFVSSRNDQVNSNQGSPIKSTHKSLISSVNQNRALKSATKCQRDHRHAKSCARTKETDIASIQSKAFRYLILQKADYEQVPGHEDRSIRASFYPSARLPAELLDKIEQNLKFQRQMYIPDKILQSRPLTTPNSRSRFHRPNTAGTNLHLERKRRTEQHPQESSRPAYFDVVEMSSKNRSTVRDDTSKGKSFADINVYADSVVKQQSLGPIDTENSQNDQLFSHELVDISHLQDICASPQKMEPVQIAQNSTLYSQQVEPHHSLGYTAKTESIRDTEEPRMVVVFSQRDQIGNQQPKKNSLRPSQKPQNLQKQNKNQGRSKELLQVKGQLLGDKQAKNGKERVAFKNRRQMPNELDLLLSVGLREDPYKDYPEARPGATNLALMNIPKSTWISPFAHVKACSQTKSKNLNMNKCGNLERSFNVTHCLSLNSSLRPHKLFKNRNAAYLKAQNLPFQ